MSVLLGKEQTQEEEVSEVLSFDKLHQFWVSTARKPALASHARLVHCSQGFPLTSRPLPQSCPKLCVTYSRQSADFQAPRIT